MLKQIVKPCNIAEFFLTSLIGNIGMHPDYWNGNPCSTPTGCSHVRRTREKTKSLSWNFLYRILAFKVVTAALYAVSSPKHWSQEQPASVADIRAHNFSALLTSCKSEKRTLYMPSHRVEEVEIRGCKAGRDQQSRVFSPRPSDCCENRSWWVWWFLIIWSHFLVTSFRLWIVLNTLFTVDPVCWSFIKTVSPLS